MGARRLVTGPTPAKAGETLQAFKETGVQPKLTDLATGRVPAMAESFTRQTLTGAPIIDKALTAQATRLTEAAGEFTSRLGPILGQSEQAVGQSAKQAILSGLERGQGLEDTMWTEFQTMAPGTQVTPIGMVGWARDVLGRERQGLATAQDSKSRQLAREILRKSHDAQGTLQSVPLEQLDLWRKDIGQTLKKSELISGFDQGRLRHLYGTLMDDAETGIQYTGSQALQDKWQEVRGFSKQLIELYRNSSVAKVVDMTPEAITAQLTGAGGITQLRQWKAAIRGEIDPQMGPDAQQAEAWNLARRHVFESILGETTHGAGKAVQPGARGLSATTISGKQLGRVMDRMGDDVLNELLESGERRALTNIRIVANAMEKGGRVGRCPIPRSRPKCGDSNAADLAGDDRRAGLGGTGHGGGGPGRLAPGPAGDRQDADQSESGGGLCLARVCAPQHGVQPGARSAAKSGHVRRLIGLSQEAGATPEAPEGTPARRRGLTLTDAPRSREPAMTNEGGQSSPVLRGGGAAHRVLGLAGISGPRPRPRSIVNAWWMPRSRTH